MSFTKEQPKPLVNVGGLPMICYALALLKQAGVTSIICNLHYFPQQIIDFFKRNNNFGFEITYSVEESLLGTGGGLKACRTFFTDEKFFLLNSDIITDLRLEQLGESFAVHGASIALYSVQETEATVSAVGDEVVDFKNVLRSVILPRYDYMGAALLSPEIFEFLEDGFSSIVYTGFTSLIQKRSLGFYEHNGLWIDAGTVDSLHKANELLAAEQKYLVRNAKEILGKIV